VGCLEWATGNNLQTGYGTPDVLELRDVERPAIGDDGVLV